MTAMPRHAPTADRPPHRAHPSLPARLPLLLEPAHARAPRRRARHGNVEARVRRGGRARRAACPSFRRRADRAARHRRTHAARRALRALHQPHHLGRRGQREAVGRAGRGGPRSCAALVPGRGRGDQRSPRPLRRRLGEEARLRRHGDRGRPAADGQRGRQPRQPASGRRSSSIWRSSSARAGSKWRTPSTTAGRSRTAPR